MINFFQKKGFILVYTLWFMAIFSITVISFHLWVYNLIELNIKNYSSAFAEIEMQNTFNELLYTLTTKPYTYTGVKTSFSEQDEIDNVLPDGSEIKFDLTFYKTMNTYFAIQDEGGLININYLDRIKINRLFSILNIPENDWGGLFDKLQDYMDKDDFNRLNGAERNDYFEKELAPPTNNFLKTQGEVNNILDWNKYTNLLWEGNIWNNLITTVSTNIPNINTAPKENLQIIFNISDFYAQTIIDRRNIIPFFNEVDVKNTIGFFQEIDPMDMHYFPSSKLRLHIWHKHSAFAYIIGLELSPYSDANRPWIITSIYRTSSNEFNNKSKESNNVSFSKEYKN